LASTASGKGAAAAKKGGAGGVSQAVGKDFAKADKGGKLPERKKAPIYDHPRS
jgi:hypothetical protein